MGLRKTIAKFLYEEKRPRSRVSERDDLVEFIELLKPRPISLNLVRIGGVGDGGYLVPDDLEGVGYCFSPGVSTVSSFEEELANKYSIRSFLADASIENPPIFNKFFSFEKKFLGSRDEGDYIRLESWVSSKEKQISNCDLLLQMDIEGYEYDVLVDTSSETLRRFRVMIIEFHTLQMLFESYALRLLKPLIEKIVRDFTVVHIHPNNCKGLVERNGIYVPKVMEVTFLRKDRVPASGNLRELVFPHPLDAKNIPSKPDVVLPDLWWKET